MRLTCNSSFAVLLVLLVSAGTTDAAACAAPYTSVVSVECTAQNGETESQFPKDESLPTYAAPGTDCMVIQTPIEEDVGWKECLRTVQFDFDWRYVGPDDATLVSVKRDITNSLGVYPEETTNLVQSYWAQEIWTGWGLKDTYHQIVVDLCFEPISYTYKLMVDIEMPDGTTCTDEAEYVYNITANFGETIGYTAFKDGPLPQSAEGIETSEGMEVPENLGDTSSAPFLGGGLVISAIVVASNMFM
mmetsp:Transcript_8086/g.13383  ORF Transcript_8086/g.13383 Transcript_8086/m.13383 type:complete len:246 (-) Transcript_8086:190-927(-)|eukprot:CAMPEP_0197719344 /NCGR_PEP_ID=MMETSP1434-20131217/3142_1 /TAXON_ID=265543 /ORGANISM="Minutocellus polymorphus, Strain CCMP3303" /LENGTH=245 /DNA_ID=CAMNT_0043304087 /DNA_START=147 /DNA_END=884 /DNA_ORIENTATION=-